MARLSRPMGQPFCRPKDDAYRHGLDRQGYQAKGVPSPADMWQHPYAAA